VLNLPSDAQVDAVNRLAYLTGSNPVPPGKTKRHYQFEEDKFGISGLTPLASETVAAARALECPIQLEAKIARVNPVMADEYDYSVHERGGECTLEGIVCIEVRVTRVHAHPSVLMDGKRDRIDPDRWKPLIMSFQRFYGLGPELSESRLAGIPESMYRTPDIDRANVIAPEAQRV
jgi:flavin reductase (DIM6/NTAB) family NADH-FMN oxidoreductase RutF